jgi:hypothetical protein
MADLILLKHAQLCWKCAHDAGLSFVIDKLSVDVLDFP